MMLPRRLGFGRFLHAAAIVFVVALLSACETTRAARPAEPPGVVVAEDAASTIYRKRCSSCHALFTPRSHTDAAWDRVLPEMAERAQLTASEQGILRAWLLRAN